MCQAARTSHQLCRACLCAGRFAAEAHGLMSEDLELRQRLVVLGGGNARCDAQSRRGSMRALAFGS